MATVGELLVDSFDRIRDAVTQSVDGLSVDQLAYQIDSRSNSIAWLIWHLTRVQDDHVAAAGGFDQVWTAQGWVQRFGLPFDPAAHGYGHSAAEVQAVRPKSAALLTDYHRAVHRQTVDYVKGLEPADLDRVVDERWDPPVTLAVRLVSVIADDLQHVGQAEFIRGVIDRSK
jgi:uncharacterized damage-inducible protein DinB